MIVVAVVLGLLSVFFAVFGRMVVSILRYFVVWRARSKAWNLPFLGDWFMARSMLQRDGQVVDAFHEAVSAVGKGKTTFPPLVHAGLSLSSGRPMILVTSAEGLRDVLLKTDVFRKSDHFNRLLRGWLGNGLVASDGALWHRQRKLLTPLFHLTNLKSYVGQVAEEAESMCDKIEGACNDGATSFFNVPAIMSDTALRVIVKAMFGTHVDVDVVTALWSRNTESFRSFVIAMLIVPLMFVRLLPFRELGVFFDTLGQLRNMFEGVVDKIRQDSRGGEHATADRMSPDLIARIALLKDETGEWAVDRTVCVDEALTFTFAAQDTTANTMAFAMFYLGRDANGKGIQEQLRAESQRVLNGAPITDASQVADLKLHRAVIKETLRLNSPVPRLPRVVTEDTYLEGQLLPAGTEVVAMFAAPCLSEEHWPNAKSFEPSRWLSDTKHHPFAFLPFSAGSRNCIGSKFALQEAVILLHALVHRFDVHIENPSSMVPAFKGTVQPVDMDCRFTKRSSKPARYAQKTKDQRHD